MIHTVWSNRCGPEPVSVEDVVDVRHYAILSCVQETTTTATCCVLAGRLSVCPVWVHKSRTEGLRIWLKTFYSLRHSLNTDPTYRQRLPYPIWCYINSIIIIIIQICWICSHLCMKLAAQFSGRKVKSQGHMGWLQFWIDAKTRTDLWYVMRVGFSNVAGILPIWQNLWLGFPHCVMTHLCRQSTWWLDLTQAMWCIVAAIRLLIVAFCTLLVGGVA